MTTLEMQIQKSDQKMVPILCVFKCDPLMLASLKIQIGKFHNSVSQQSESWRVAKFAWTCVLPCVFLHMAFQL